MNHEKIDFDFDMEINRIGTGSDKWRMYEERKILPMWLADMDFKSPPAVLEALHNRTDHGIFGYTHARKELIRIVRDRLWEKYQWEIEEEWIVWIPGLVVGINAAVRATGSPGDDVITTVPIYPPFLSAPGFGKRNLITCRMDYQLVAERQFWNLDIKKFEHALTTSCHTFLFCNPHNPTGRVFERHELEEIAEVCLRNNVLICSDEIHCDLLFSDKSHIPIATLSSEVAENTITLMAPSKTFNIPGLGCSFAIIPNQHLRSGFMSTIAGIVPHVNIMGYEATLAAYKYGSDWLEQLLDYLTVNRNVVYEEIQSLYGLQVNEIEGTYLAWIDTRGTGLQKPVRFFENAGVGLGNGKAFDGTGYLRMTFACPERVLRSAFEKIKVALTKL